MFVPLVLAVDLVHLPRLVPVVVPASVRLPVAPQLAGPGEEGHEAGTLQVVVVLLVVLVQRLQASPG